MSRFCVRAHARSVALAALLLMLVVPASALATPPLSTPGAVISNGTVMLGVTQWGDLNYNCAYVGDTGCPAASTGGGVPNANNGTQVVGIRYVPLNTDATADGCACEGWGVGDAASGLAGGANESAGNLNITPVSFVKTATTAVSTVEISDPSIPGYALRVVHDYHPSTISPNLYEVSVSITNTGTHPIANLLYRRAMDWDIEPTAYSEWVTIANVAASRQLVWDSDDGFSAPSPLGPRTYLQSQSVCGTGYTGTCEFKDLGSSDGPGPYTYPLVTTPADHGAVFDFAFGALPVGQARTFKTYYGAAPSEATALAAIDQQGIGVYSLGEPDCQGDAGIYANGLCTGLAPFAGVISGLPNTFTFGFLTAEADLSVVASAPTASVSAGGTTDTTYTVRSAGPDRAPDVHLTIPIPAGLGFVSATPSTGTCTFAAPNVVCDLGFFASGASATVALSLTGTAAGSSLLVATTDTLADDATSANNSATTAFTITAATTAPLVTPTPAPVMPTPPAVHEKPLAKHKRPAVRRAPAAAGAGIGVDELFVAASGRMLPVSCRLSTGRVSTCGITLVASSDGHRITIGHGQRTFRGSAARATVSVNVALTPAGRALARRPGGYKATVLSTIHAVGITRAFHSDASTQIVLPTLLVLSGDLLFDTGSAVVKPAALAFIDKLKGRITGAKSLVCNGYTDSQGTVKQNVLLGAARADAVCALFARGTSEQTRSVSLGQTHPRESNDSAAGRAQNRRVEIHVSY